MTEEATQRINEIKAKRRGDLARNIVLIASCLSSAFMAGIVGLVVTQERQVAGEYVVAAQKTVKTVCKAADEKALSANAKRDCQAAEENRLPQELLRVVDNPDPNDPEFQDSESQEPEQQESESQDPEVQDPEVPDAETNDPDPVDDTDLNDPEVDDPEVQDAEVQDPEVQEPEEQNAPVCPDGYARAPFHYFGPDGIDNTGDEEDWIVCKKVG